VIVGCLLLVAFVLNERRAAAPIMPLTLFRSRQFSAGNAVTLIVYAALAGALFLIPVQLQVVSGFPPVAAGSALLPVTVVMLLLSARMGRLAQRVGPRLPMTVGPIVAGAGLLLLVRVGAGSSYFSSVLPAVLVFALGLSATVAPLTATVLASAEVRHAGVASGVNNAVARAAGLLAVAGLPLAVGLTGGAYHQANVLHPAFQRAMWICGFLLVAGGVLSALTIDNNVLRPVAGHEVPKPEARVCCPVGAPQLEPAQPASLARPRPAASRGPAAGPGDQAQAG
jgi:MFS family permease